MTVDCSSFNLSLKLYIEDTFNHMAVTKSRPHLPVVWSDVGEAVDGGGAAELAQLAQRVLPVHVEDLSGEEECVHRLGAVSVFPLHCPRRNNIVSEASPQLLQLSRHEPHHTAQRRHA